MIKNLKLSEDEVSQVLDVQELTGLNLVSYPDVKLKIAQIAIDRILTRTAEGKSNIGNNLAPYSKSYKNSLEFKAAGKSNTVNMYLFGDMLGSIDITANSGNLVKIGFLGNLQNKKAYGHMTGMKGNPILEGKTPKRQFFGVPYSELKMIVRSELREDLDQIKNDLKELSQSEKDLLRAQAYFESRILDLEDELDGI